MAAVAAPLFENGDTIHARQAEVEHDEAVIFGIALEPGAFAVMDEFHGIARRREDRTNVLRNPGVILNDQQTH
ncbi:hypothetical protein D3C71_2190950 [compost metagenome]